MITADMSILYVENVLKSAITRCSAASRLRNNLRSRYS